MPINGYRRSGFLTICLFLAAVLGTSLIMLYLGTYFVRQYRAQQLQGAATAGALYVEGFLAPHAQELFATQILPEESKEKITRLLNRYPVSDHFEMLRIWDQTGKFVFSTDNTTKDDDERFVEMARALQGEVVVEIYTEHTEHPSASLQLPYLEIHAPIFDTSSRKIIAIGEVYQDATGFMRERAIVERSIWTVLGVFSVFGLGGTMVLICVQRKTLLRHLAEVSAVARQNQILKDEANRTRIEASQSNEQLLNQIGAELHDGPIQMLSLMMLMAGKEKPDAITPDGMTSIDIGNRVISELRNISTGLSLPEIADLSLQDVLLLAISRHEIFTGQKVETAFGALPETVDQGLKICCYRFVQEGLTNSNKHAGGSAQRVSGHVTDNFFIVTVSNDAEADRPLVQKGDSINGGTGLIGLRHRLGVFGGKLTFSHRSGGITELTATIPLQ